MKGHGEPAMNPVPEAPTPLAKLLIGGYRLAVGLVIWWGVVGFRGVSGADLLQERLALGPVAAAALVACVLAVLATLALLPGPWWRRARRKPAPVPVAADRKEAAGRMLSLLLALAGLTFTDANAGEEGAAASLGLLASRSFESAGGTEGSLRLHYRHEHGFDHCRRVCVPHGPGGHRGLSGGAGPE